MLIDEVVYSNDPRKLQSYWTDVNQILTRRSRIMAAVNEHTGIARLFRSTAIARTHTHITYSVPTALHEPLKAVGDKT